MQELANKNAVITGAASGIGRGLAHAFAARGVNLVLADVETAPLRELERELGESGVAVHSLSCDVADPASVEQLANESFERCGAIHILCNNAGVAENNLATWELELADWDWVLGVNLMGVVHGVRHFVPRMIAGGEPGHIVNTASIGGLVAGTALPAYTVSKHAVVALSEILYNDLRRRGSVVSASVLCPGWVNTRIAESDRNRDVKPPLDERLEKSRAAFQRSIAQGLEPIAVGELVADGITEDRFYLYTHPEWNDAVRDRFAAIENGLEPASTLLPRA